MKPGGMHFAATRSDGIGSKQGVAPSAASFRIFVPEIYHQKHFMGNEMACQDSQIAF